MNNQNYFYDLVRKIQPLSQNEQQAELNKLLPQVDQQESENLKPKISSFQDASSEINKMKNEITKQSRIKDKIKELDQIKPKIYSFFSSNEDTINKIQELRVKRDFCRSLSIFSTLPNEILKEARNENYELATKYLQSMIGFFSDPKYNTLFINNVKQQFSTEYFSELNNLVEKSMFIHTNEDDRIHKSIHAVGFQITVKYLGIDKFNDPSASNDPIKRIEIMKIFGAYFTSWTNVFITETSKGALNKFIEAGKALLIIDNDIQNYILKLPCLNLENKQDPKLNELIRSDIDKSSKEFYLTIYNRYVNFSNFSGIFYTRRDIFKVDQISQLAEQSNEEWKKLVPEAMSMRCIVLLNGILDLKEKCQNSINEYNFYDFIAYFYYLRILIIDIRTKNDLPDFQFLEDTFKKYHLNFKFRFNSSNEKEIKTAIITSIYFNTLFNSIPETNRISEIISGNFSSRCASAISNYIVSNFLANAPLTPVLSQISNVLNSIFDDINRQNDNKKSLIEIMKFEAKRCSINLQLMSNLILYQALSSLSNYYLQSVLDESKFNKIKEQEISLAEWYLNLLRKDIKSAPIVIGPFINLLRIRVAKKHI